MRPVPGLSTESPGVEHQVLDFRTPCPPSGSGRLHEIRLDGFRILARRDGAGVRLLTRNGIDCAGRYPGINRSCLLDGEVVICGEDGIPIFNRLRQGKQVKGEAR